MNLLPGPNATSITFCAGCWRSRLARQAFAGSGVSKTRFLRWMNCQLAPENEDVAFEVRQMVFGRKPHYYRVLFTIESESVVVLHIRHGRRERASDLRVQP